MNDRSAVDTIRGYIYQFNKSICEILDQPNDSTTITIEGIEDIDINADNEENFIQCKYYSSKEYNHSVIKQAIINFLKHYAENKNDNSKYYLYANFKSGQEKLPNNLDLNFIKEKFLTYSKSGIVHIVYDELSLSDDDLNNFIKKLYININAVSYEDLENDISNKIKKIPGVIGNILELYIVEAESIIKKIATTKDVSGRKISKKDFVNLLLNTNVMIDDYFLYKIGKEKYYSCLRKKLFSVQNISPFERFFIIDCHSITNVNSLKEILYFISDKWSKISKREINPFCPYVVLHNISDEILSKLKNQLFLEGKRFNDGYSFKNAQFNVEYLSEEPNYYNKVCIKFVELNQLYIVLANIKKRKVIYEFYYDNPIFNNIDFEYNNIKINNLEDIKYIV